MTERDTIPLLRRGRWYTSLDTTPVPGPAGLRLSLAPPAMVTADARWHRRQPVATPLDRASRMRLLGEAMIIFTSGSVHIGGLGDQDESQFRAHMAAVAGVPGTMVDRWCDLLRQRLDVLAAGPSESADPARRAGTTGGPPSLSLVSLPANTFTTLESVCMTLSGGGATWVRPSRREPISAVRFVASVIAAGWPAAEVGFYPGRPADLAALVRATDRQVLYGGESLLARVGAASGASVRGPGRGCAVVHGDDPVGAADWLLPMVAGDSGRFCTAVRTVVCLAGAPAVAAALAERLDRIPLHPADPDLPIAWCPDAARAGLIAERIMRDVGTGDVVTTRRPVRCTVDGRAFLAPTLVLLADPGTGPRWHPLVGREVPFPFVVVTQASAARARAIAASSAFVYVHHRAAIAFRGTKGELR
jgi:hypothetical protein